MQGIFYLIVHEKFRSRPTALLPHVALDVAYKWWWTSTDRPASESRNRLPFLGEKEFQYSDTGRSATATGCGGRGSLLPTSQTLRIYIITVCTVLCRGICTGLLFWRCYDTCGGYLVKGKHTRGGWREGLCPVNFDHSFDQLPERGRYATLQSVALSIRETLRELMNVDNTITSWLLLYVHFHTMGFHMTSEPFCQYSSFHLSILNTHHLT